jgi:hypothetical protein
MHRWTQMLRFWKQLAAMPGVCLSKRINDIANANRSNAPHCTHLC